MNTGTSELLAPAGDFDTALAAFKAGADAVYCGLLDFSARQFARNFSADELSALMRYARANGKKVYVTFNTIIDEAKLDDAVKSLAELEDIGPDAIIVQDLGVAAIARKYFPGLALHASTQLVAHNLEGVLSLKELGFSRVVLARELSLQEVASIAKRCGVELECFIHGALCYSLSGLCLFSAMEKGRSGNRGRCAYCCRMQEGSIHPYSMKDMRLGGDARRLAEAGVASLKIEGRMKSPLYVASVVKYYRDILDGAKPCVTEADLESVFSRRTTKLYLDGRAEGSEVIDAESVGHIGTKIGTVKRITRDREGRSWLRFHTLRALEKHDGLQFMPVSGGKPLGFGIGEMRKAISRHAVFETMAGDDVEVLLPEGEEGEELRRSIRQGDGVYCSMSNAVKRRFPVPSFRSSDWPGVKKIDVALEIAPGSVSAKATCGELAVSVSVSGVFAPANNPGATFPAAEKAFSRLGDSVYSLGNLSIVDADRLFVPMGVMNALRRDIVSAFDAKREELKSAKIASVRIPESDCGEIVPRLTVKVRPDQPLPGEGYAEIVVAMMSFGKEDVEAVRSCAEKAKTLAPSVRISLPPYVPEMEFNKMRIAAKGLVRLGFDKWEVSGLGALRMLKALGVEDVSADWTLYAFNSASLASLAALGVKRFVASPENGAENLAYLAESGYDVELIANQTAPLFMSLTEPAAKESAGGRYRTYRLGRLWVTAKCEETHFGGREGVSARTDFSWNEPGK
ncbi:MAG: U32 family peptidase [Kiritimatiellae bacterium]|nr:U32 family peptidase [Kiritimatiellia bacterium]